MFIKRKFDGTIGWAALISVPPDLLTVIADDDAELGTFLAGKTIDLTTGRYGGEFVPDQVTKLQMKRALLAVGALPTVEAYVAAASTDVQMSWTDASVFPRSDPMIIAAATAMSLDADALFIAASKL